jgi:hypothetical protein
MSFESLVLNNLKKYKVLAIAGVFVSFFVVVGILNYFQKVTLEGFVSLGDMATGRVNSVQTSKFTNKKEHFGHCGKKN